MPRLMSASALFGSANKALSKSEMTASSWYEFVTDGHGGQEPQRWWALGLSQRENVGKPIHISLVAQAFFQL